MPDYPPYVNGYGGISRLFAEIKSASVPPKFTQDFMSTALGLRSSSYRAMIPLLKKLGFVDPANVPTQAYRDFRDDTLSGALMAQRLREAYAPLFAANEYAWKLDKKELYAKLKNVTGAGDDDSNLSAVVGTFLELSRLAKWEGAAERRPADSNQPIAASESSVAGGDPHSRPLQSARIGLSYTINLNLPATTDIEVFNAIFKSLRENLLRGE
jgi:hypothetical protein